MTTRPDPHAARPLQPAADPAPGAAWEQTLQQAVRQLPCGADPTRLADLQVRVLADWESGQAVQRGPRQPGAKRPRGGWRVRWMWFSGLASGLALSVMLAAGLGVRIPGLGNDPALDELMQVDVLSQMAIGEM